jgi:hypothetical protein
MSRTVPTSLAALILLMPTLTASAPSAEARQHSVGRHSASPLRGAARFKSSRPIILRQQFNRTTQGTERSSSRRSALNKPPSLGPNRLAPKLSNPGASIPTQVAKDPASSGLQGRGNGPTSKDALPGKTEPATPGTPTGKLNKVGGGAGGIQKAKEALAAQEKATGTPTGKLNKVGGGAGGIQKAKEALAAQEKATGTPTGKLNKVGGGAGGIQKAKEALAAQEKAKAEQNNKDIPIKDPGSDSDKDHVKGQGRPPLIVVVPGHVGDGHSDGDRQDGAGYRYAPSMVEPGPRYSVPRTQSRPQQLQSAKIKKDEPVCVEGVWAIQDNEKKYVCLSWYFRGQIYTPDQMAQVLAQLQPQAQ